MKNRWSWVVWVGVWIGIFPAFAQAEEAAAGSYTSVTAEKLEELSRLHREAREQTAKKNYSGALLSYENALLIEPDDEAAYVQSGRIFLAMGNFSKAENAFRNALEINPDNENALAGLKQIVDPDGVRGLVGSAETESD